MSTCKVGYIRLLCRVMHNLSAVLSDIEAFLASTGMAASTFGQKAVHDWQLVDRLRAGGDVTMRTAVRIQNFITESRAAKFRPRPRRKPSNQRRQARSARRYASLAFPHGSQT